jgi:hypothetical protein
MDHSSPSISLIRAVDDIYQALIRNNCFSLALKALELKAKLLKNQSLSRPSLPELLSQLSDQDLETLTKQLKKSSKSKRSKDE